jgi:antitoxin HicB
MEGINMVKHKSIGSDFDDWLAEEGILKEVEIAATKKAFVIQLQAEMKKKKIGKSRLAKIMKTSRTAIERLLDPCQSSNSATLIEAALAMGKRLSLSMV